MVPFENEELLAAVSFARSNQGEGDWLLCGRGTSHLGHIMLCSNYAKYRGTPGSATVF